MTKQINDRVLQEAKYINFTHDTVRKTASIYGVSKSTVHHDMAVKLEYIDRELYLKINKILQENFQEKHIRGGFATKRKYQKIKRKQGV